MSKFRVTYPSGAVEEVEQSDCKTVEQFANAKFGYANYVDFGVKVELVKGFGEVNEQEQSHDQLDSGSDSQEQGGVAQEAGDSAGQEDSGQNA